MGGKIESTQNTIVFQANNLQNVFLLVRKRTTSNKNKHMQSEYRVGIKLRRSTGNDMWVWRTILISFQASDGICIFHLRGTKWNLFVHLLAYLPVCLPVTTLIQKLLNNLMVLGHIVTSIMPWLYLGDKLD